MRAKTTLQEQAKACEKQGFRVYAIMDDSVGADADTEVALKLTGRVGCAGIGLVFGVDNSEPSGVAYTLRPGVGVVCSYRDGT